MKNPFKSKTMWVNAIGMCLTLAQMAGIQAVPITNPLITSAVLAGINMILRKNTSQPLGFATAK